MLLSLVALPLLLLLSAVHATGEVQGGRRRHAARRLGRSSHQARLDVPPAPGNRSLSRRATLPAGWSLLVSSTNDGAGCYADSSTSRALSTRIGGSNGIETCIAACQKGNYVYAGVQYGLECWVRVWLQLATSLISVWQRRLQHLDLPTQSRVRQELPRVDRQMWRHLPHQHLHLQQARARDLVVPGLLLRY